MFNNMFERGLQTTEGLLGFSFTIRGAAAILRTRQRLS